MQEFKNKLSYPDYITKKYDTRSIEGEGRKRVLVVDEKNHPIAQIQIGADPHRQEVAELFAAAGAMYQLLNEICVLVQEGYTLDPALLQKKIIKVMP